MINIKLLHNNTIVTLEIPSKATIKSSAGAFHPNSMELLCVALGSCIGKHIVRYCSQEKINVQKFEQISIDMHHNDFIVNIAHPKGMSLQNLIDLKQIVTTCDVAKLLKSRIDVKFSPNKVEPDLNRKSKPCCGG